MNDMSTPKNFPKRVRITVEHPNPEGLVVHLLFGMNWKNAHSYLVFPDPNGVVEVDREELFKSFDEERNTFIMDFADPRLAFSGEITAKVLSLPEVQKALETYRLFRRAVTYPEGYEQKLEKALKHDFLPVGSHVKVEALPD